jgi:hypothetical protein
MPSKGVGSMRHDREGSRKNPRPERHKPMNPRKSRLGASKSIPSNPNILKLSLALSLGA